MKHILFSSFLFCFHFFPLHTSAQEVWQPVGNDLITYNGFVNVLYADGDSVLYAGGRFNDFKGIRNNDVCLIKWDGREWTTVGAPPISDASVTTILRNGPDLFVGGDFKHVGNDSSMARIVRWDGNEWHALKNGLNRRVNTMIVYQGDLVVGGNFRSPEGTPPESDFVTRWDGNQWMEFGEKPRLFRIGVIDFTIKDRDLYAVGNGYFREPDSHTNYRAVARYDGEKWNALKPQNDQPLMRGAPGTILNYKGGLLFGGGNVYSETNEALHRLNFWDGSNFIRLGETTGEATIYTIHEEDGELYVGGNFYDIGGNEDVNYIAKLKGNKWEKVGNRLNWVVNSIVNFQGELYVGGKFYNVGGQYDFNYIAKLGNPIPDEFKISHYQIEIDTETRDTSTLFLRSYNSDTGDGSDKFSVCADNSISSIFVIESLNGNSIRDWNLKVENNNFQVDADILGSFEITKHTPDSLVALYTHPDCVQSSRKTAELILKIYNTSSANDEVANLLLELYRPPVLFVHGIWANSNSFTSLDVSLNASGKYDLFQTVDCDYEDSNDENFEANVKVINDCIEGKTGIIELYNSMGIAIGKVDIIAHSMGGILSRLYLQEEQSNNKLHKLITINTPHAGSQMANYIIDTPPNLRNELLCGYILPASGRSCYNGAVHDLRVNSQAIINLNSTIEPIVPSHTIGSYVTFDLFELFDFSFLLEMLSSGLNKNDLSDIFNNQKHDGIVALGSQLGGLVPSASTVFEDKDHIQILKETLLINKVLFLLNEKSSSPYFDKSGFYPVNQSYTNNLSNSKAESGIEIIQPKELDLFFVGDKISIEFLGSLNINRTRIRMENGLNNDINNSIAEIPDNQGEVEFEIKKNPSLGKRSLLVTSTDSEGELLDLKIRNILVSTKESPQHLKVSPWQQTIMVGEEEQISVKGYFEGFTSKLDSLPELEVDIQDEDIAKFLGNKTIKGISIGETELTATFNGVTSQPIKIIVTEQNVTSIKSNAPKIEESIYSKRVYPNPSKQEFILEFYSRLDFGTKISIHNYAGKTILAMPIQVEQGLNKQKINLSYYPDGLYYMQFMDNSGHRITEVLIKTQ